MDWLLVGEFDAWMAGFGRDGTVCGREMQCMAKTERPEKRGIVKSIQN